MTAPVMAGAAGGMPNAMFELDAGLSASYSSGQTWANIAAIASPTAYDFCRGVTTGAAADDPTFNGSAGNNSANEYWSLDAGDYFTLIGANTTFLNSLHKENAAFTWYGLIQTGSGAAGGALIGTTNELDTGILLHLDTGTIRFKAYNAGVQAYTKSSAGFLSANTKYFVALSFSEGGESGFFYKNNGSGRGTAGFTGGYSSPASGNASHKMQIGADGDNGNVITADSRIWRTGMFAAPLSVAQIDRIYETYKYKLGL